MILSNQAKCLKCGDAPYSANRHDYQECICGNVSVDGGMLYIRHSWKDKNYYENISIEWDPTLVESITAELKSAQETGRNPLGLTCAVARVMRDRDYEIVKVNRKENDTTS